MCLLELRFDKEPDMYTKLQQISIRRARLCLILSVFAVLLTYSTLQSFAKLMPLVATTPSSGTISPSSKNLSYTGGPFVIPTNSTDSAAGPVDCNQVNPCEDFGLTIDIPQSYKDGHPTDFIKIEVSLNDPTGGQDLDIFLVDNPDDRSYPAHASNGGSNP